MFCLIIDETLEQLQPLKELLEQRKEVDVVHTAIHPYEAKYVLTSVPIDIVFIRFKLWDPIYFKDFKTLPTIVFTANGREGYRESEKEELGFAMKEPYTAKQLSQVFMKMIGAQPMVSADFFFVKFEKRYRKIDFEKIELIERKVGYVLICTTGANFLVAGSINQVLNRLPKGRFKRVADAIILPAKEASRLTGNTYCFRGREIPLTFRFAKAGRLEEMEEVDH